MQVLDVDARGNVKLSRKALLPKPKGEKPTKGFGPPPVPNASPPRKQARSKRARAAY